jgi:cytochrome c biogenesis protein CcdA
MRTLALIGATERGFTFGVLVAAFWFGVRHGIDWDHIAAITDITSSQEERRHALLFGTLYVLGHALVVLVLGVIAILAGDFVPESIDAIMTRVVGGTLVLLGVYVSVSLIRHGRDFRLRSRWMLVFSGIRRATRWAKSRWRSWGDGPARHRPAAGLDRLGREVGVEASSLLTQAEAREELPVASWHHGHHGRPGHHHHAMPEPDDTFMTYGRSTSFGVGMIHGVGAETPTQVLLFLAAAGAGGYAAGVLVLVAFIVGLVASNSLITLGSAFGFLRASQNFPVYATVAVLTALFSLAIGIIFLFGQDNLLPAFFGG